jgi:hypothetical protein
MIRREAAMLAVIIGGVLACSGLANAASAGPGISRVKVSGSSAAPRIAVIGHGFGAKPPRRHSASNTLCGHYGHKNGYWYGSKGLWFKDLTHSWSAGRGDSRANGACIGLIVKSWSRTKVVFKFGAAYGSFDHWKVYAGDQFFIELKGLQQDGVAHYK